ncbi:uncharacterized protein LOC134248338 isoform X2 [Saccostrea cucullata]|uniref:uncharacterized protein LOC134248338 isoform X2 n=1 Tax=Saccostrea cuccullata TaxID=36930 RepID=UPI002ED45B2A
MARLKQFDEKKEAERIKHRKVTGGGPAMSDDVKPWEQLIIGTFTKRALEGVQGGIDTAATTERDTCEETEFETGVLANSLPSADGVAVYPYAHKTREKILKVMNLPT